MKPRRVITGHDADGNAIFVSDEELEPVTLALAPGLESFESWSEKGERVVPFDGPPPGVPRYFPDKDEVVFRLINFPPESQDSGASDFSESAVADAEKKLPGFIQHFELDHPGMHTTDSVDFGIVINGDITLELDNGAERHLKPGDCVIQNGTRHAWRNRSGKVATMAFILLGAKRTATGK